MAVSLVACGGGESTGGDTEGEVQQQEIQQEKPAVKNPVRSELYDEEDYFMADITYEYDADGKRLSNTTIWTDDGGGGSETDYYEYDANGNVIKKTSTYSSSPDYEFARHYTYDADGKLISEDFGTPDNGYRYTYDSEGRLASKMLFNGDEESLVSTYSYEGSSQIETELWEDWVLTYRTDYDADGNVLKYEYAADDEIMFLMTIYMTVKADW